MDFKFLIKNHSLICRFYVKTARFTSGCFYRPHRCYYYPACNSLTHLE